MSTTESASRNQPTPSSAKGAAGSATGTTTGIAKWQRLLLFAALGLVALSVTRSLSGQDVLTNSGTSQALLALALPVGLAGLGGLVSERAGVVNIGLEGMMILGCWFAGYAGYLWGPWGALVGALLGGAIGGLLHAIATVTFGVDHIVSGVAINLLAAGAARFLSELGYKDAAGGGPTQSPPMKGTIPTFDVPIRRTPSRTDAGGQPVPDPGRAHVPAGRLHPVAHRFRPSAEVGG